jgi:hypothetical protein
MSVHANHDENLSAVRRMKAQENPITGKPNTYADIAATLKFSRQAAFWYGKKLAGRGVCPGCLRKLEEANER